MKRTILTHACSLAARLRGLVKVSIATAVVALAFASGTQSARGGSPSFGAPTYMLPGLLSGFTASEEEASDEGAKHENPRKRDPGTKSNSPKSNSNGPKSGQVTNLLSVLEGYVPGDGDWSLVPGTAFEFYRQTDSQSEALGVMGAEGPRAVLTNKNGAAYDPAGHAWYFWGGGDTSYGGNEVYSLGLEAVAGQMLTSSSTLDDVIFAPNDVACPVPATAPAAGSTYDGVVWSPATQTFFVFPVAAFCLDANISENLVWEFDPATQQWSSLIKPSALNGPVMAAYDPVTDKILAIGTGADAKLVEFDPATGVFSAARSLGQALSAGSATLRPESGDLLVVAPEGVFAVPLAEQGSIQKLADLPQGLVASAGAVFDSSLGMLVLWDGGPDVHTFDPDTAQWGVDDNGSGNGPSGQGDGVYSKWIHVPELGVYAGYNNVDEGLWLYNLATADLPGDAPAPANAAPIADAGPDQGLAAGGTAWLDGTGSSDPDGDPLSYSWKFTSMPSGASPILSDAQGATPSFAPDVDGNYTIELTVSDGSLIAKDSTVVEVKSTGSSDSGSANSPPVCNAGPDAAVATGSTVNLDGSLSSDPDGDTLSYSWSFVSRPSGSQAELSGATGAFPSFVADVDGTYTVGLTVNDGGLAGFDTVEITASGGTSGGGSTGGGTGNNPPVANAGADRWLTVGQTASLDGGASSDPDGDTLTYSWQLTSKPTGSTASLTNPLSRNPSLFLDVAGAFVISLVVSDGLATSAADSVTVTAQDGSGGTATGDLSKLGQYLPPAGQWALVPNTAFSNWSDGCDGTPGDDSGPPCTGSGGLIRITAVEANAIDPQLQAVQGSKSVVTAWNGAAYDPVRHRMYFHGGGHNAYYGNEVYELDLEALTLTRFIDPAPMTNTNSSGAPFPTYGPRSAHTYDGFVWTPNGLFTMAAGAGDDAYGANMHGTFDPTTNSWTTFGSNPYSYPLSAYDPASGLIYTLANRIQWQDGLRAIDPVDHTITHVSSPIDFWSNNGVAHIINGEFWFSAEQGLHVIDLSNPVTYTRVTTLPSGLGDYQAGWDVDDQGRFVFWSGSGSVWIYNPATDSWVQDGGSGLQVPNYVNAVFTKWVYVDGLDAFVGYANPDEGLWIYCTSDGCNPTAGGSAGGGSTGGVPTGGNIDFATLCEDSNVLFCQGFDALPPNDANINEGVFLNSSSCATATWPNNCPVIDNGTLKFTVPSQSGAGASGQYYVNFAALTGDNIMPGESVFVRWKQKFAPNFLQASKAGGGFKIGMLGDPTEYSCSTNELVINNGANGGFPRMYHACGLFTPFEEGDPLGIGDITEFDYQPGGDNDNTCLRSVWRNTGQWPAHPDCYRYFEGEWMTFQLGVDYVGGSNKDRIRLWAKREGDDSWWLVIDRQMNLVDTANGFGKMWLMPYNTGKDPSVVHPETYTWYDELVISRGFIPD